MKLKAIINKEAYDKLADGLKEAYIKQSEGDGYVLDGVDDKEFKSKLDEFRQTNNNLKKDKEELEALKEKYKGVDPEKYAKYEEQLAQINKMEEADLIKQGKIDDVIASRTVRMRGELEDRINALTSAQKKKDEEVGALRSKLGVALIDTKVQTVFNEAKIKVRDGALPDVLSRARQTWALDEKGNIVAKDGDKQAFGSDGGPLSWEEWGKGLLKSAGHLFEAAGGSGAQCGQQGNSGGDGKTIANDPMLIGRNLKDVASGKITVQTAG